MKRKYTVTGLLKKQPAIYKISIIGSEKTYIGESLDVSNRIAKHFSFLRKKIHHNPILQNLFNKYGEECFNVSIIEFLDRNKKLLKERELYYQKQEENCISLDSNKYSNQKRDKKSIEETINNLNKYREEALDKCRVPILTYNIKTKEVINYKQISDVYSIIGKKTVYKHIRRKRLVPHNDLVCFLKEDFTEENINKILITNCESLVKGEYNLYNLLTKEVLYFPSKAQFSLHIINCKDNKVYNRYNNTIDQSFRTTKEVKTLKELFSMDFIYYRSQTIIRKCNLKIYYNALLTHKYTIKTAPIIGTDRHTLEKIFNEKSIKERIKEIEFLISKYN